MLNPFPVVLIKYPDEGTLRKEEFLLAGSERYGPWWWGGQRQL